MGFLFINAVFFHSWTNGSVGFLGGEIGRQKTRSSLTCAPEVGGVHLDQRFCAETVRLVARGTVFGDVAFSQPVS